jgi:hypothetical protein
VITPPVGEYLDIIRHAHRAHIRVKLYQETPTGNEFIGEIPVVNVQFTYDGQASVMRAADIEYGIDPWEMLSRDIIEAISTEAGLLTIEHAVSDGNNAAHAWVLLATLRVDAVLSELSGSTRTLHAYDRSILVQEHLLETGRPLNDTYVHLIKSMLSETLPGETLTIDSAFTPEELALAPSPGKALNSGTPRLEEMQKLAEVIGGVVANDQFGKFELRKVVGAGLPVWTIDSGALGVLIDGSQETSRREQFNAVSIAWTPNDDDADADWRLRIFLWDDDPTSPTYYDGPFGKRPIFFDEEYDHIPSQTEAESLARERLALYSGATRSIELSAVYNPLLEPGDVIEVKFPDGTTEVHVIDALTFDMGPSARMSVTTRLDRPTTYTGTITGSASGVIREIG